MLCQHYIYYLESSDQQSSAVFAAVQLVTWYVDPPYWCNVGLNMGLAQSMYILYMFLQIRAHVVHVAMYNKLFHSRLIEDMFFFK